MQVQESIELQFVPLSLIRLHTLTITTPTRSKHVCVLKVRFIINDLRLNQSSVLEVTYLTNSKARDNGLILS